MEAKMKLNGVEYVKTKNTLGFDLNVRFCCEVSWYERIKKVMKWGKISVSFLLILDPSSVGGETEVYKISDRKKYSRTQLTVHWYYLKFKLNNGIIAYSNGHVHCAYIMDRSTRQYCITNEQMPCDSRASCPVTWWLRSHLHCCII